MATRIPLPDNNRSGLFEGLMAGHKAGQSNERLRQNRELMPIQKILMNAQSQEALASAAEKIMFARLLGYDPSQGLSQIGNQFPSQEYGSMTPNENKQQMISPQMGNPSITMASPGQLMDIGLPYQAPQKQINQSKGIAPEQRDRTTVVDPGDPNRYGIDKIAGLHPKVPPPQTHYENGNLLTYWPSGKVTSTQIGPQPGEMERIKAVGKGQGEAYNSANETSLALGEQKNNLDRIAESLENHPNPDDVIGPMNNHLTKFFGNPEDQALLGDLMSSSGNIVLEAAKNIKGAFTGRDQSLINGMKPTANDPYWVFLGKLKGMGELTALAQKRSEIYADLLHQGMPAHEALKMAQKQTNLEPVTDKYKNILKMSHQRSAVDEGRMPTFESPQEAQAFYKTLPDEIKVKLFYKAKR